MDERKIVYTPEEKARIEIQDFVNTGLRAAKKHEVYECNEVFDRLEKRYIA